MDKELIEQLREMLNEGLPAKLLGTDIQKIITALEAAELRISELEQWNAEMVEKTASGGTLEGYREMGQRIAELEQDNLVILTGKEDLRDKCERLDAALVEIENLDYRGYPHESAAIAKKARAGK